MTSRKLIRFLISVQMLFFNFKYKLGNQFDGSMFSGLGVKEYFASLKKCLIVSMLMLFIKFFFKWPLLPFFLVKSHKRPAAVICARYLNQGVEPNLNPNRKPE